jgi:hypothetical protein
MFLKNKFTEEYLSIIEKNVNQQDLIGYKERHHIIPKSLGGSNKKENIVTLSAKDHFICHQLLVEMTEGESKGKMWSALWRMMNKQSRNQLRNYNFTPEDYEKARIQHSINHSKRISGIKNPFYNKKHTNETRKKMSTLKKGKTYEEIFGVEEGKIMRERRKVETLGKKRSDETREKIRQNKIGKKRDPELMRSIGEKLKGKKQSAETIEKKKLAREAGKKICEHCQKETSLTNYKRWHGANCKNSNDVDIVG